MNGRRLNFLWLALPSVVFFLIVAVFVVRLSKQEKAATQAPVTSPTPVVNPQAVPAAVSGLPSLVRQIEGWQGEDPRLAAPAFDRKISLPAE